MNEIYDAALEVCQALHDIDIELQRIKEKQPDRRERIATAVLGAFVSIPTGTTYAQDAKNSVEIADLLIAELDRKPQEKTP